MLINLENLKIGLLFSQKKPCINFVKRCIGLHFWQFSDAVGQFFHKTNSHPERKLKFYREITLKNASNMTLTLRNLIVTF
jgi:hypothetical protein